MATNTLSFTDFGRVDTFLAPQNPTPSPAFPVGYLPQSYYADIAPATARSSEIKTSAADNNVPIAALIDGVSVSFSSIEEKIENLAAIWKRFNNGRSVTEYNHAAYMQIIGIGSQALPYLLRRLREYDADWVIALKYITGAKVTTPEMRGNFHAVREAWLQWGEEHGLRD